MIANTSEPCPVCGSGTARVDLRTTLDSEWPDLIVQLQVCCNSDCRQVAILKWFYAEPENYFLSKEQEIAFSAALLSLRRP
jgi:hypothetical protein